MTDTFQTRPVVIAVTLALAGLVTGGWAAPARWLDVYRGPGIDTLRATTATRDGGFVGVGTSSFSSADADLWAIKLDSGGRVIWQRTYGGSGTEVGYSVAETLDGGFVVAGHTSSFGAGLEDAWVVKLAADGTMEWQRSYGGPEVDIALDVCAARDGSYVVAGMTDSFGAGANDAFVLRLDPSGDVLWQRTYGNEGDERASAIQQTADDGFVIAGRTTSLASFPGDALVVKVNGAGDVEWMRTYGGSDVERAYDIVQTIDGGYAFTGFTGSFGSGEVDVWLVRLDASGAVIWEYAYGGKGWDAGDSILETMGGFVVVGESANDGLAMAVDLDGRLTWQSLVDLGPHDELYAVVRSFDGGYILVGETVVTDMVNNDAIVAMVDSDGRVDACESIPGAALIATPAASGVRDGEAKDAFSELLVGKTGAGDWNAKLDRQRACIAE